jgi:hypothetical protein
MDLETLQAQVAALQTQLRELADREAIRQVLTNYARGVDRNDDELLKTVYHADAVDDHGVWIGERDDFIEWWHLQDAKHARCQHCVYNMTIDLDGDVAHTETYYMFVAMETSGKPFIMCGGRYIDRIERRDGHWAIAARKCIRDWVPTEELLEAFDQASLTAGGAFLGARELEFINSSPQSTRDENDPSFERPMTIAPERLEHWRRLTEDAGAPAAAGA